MDSCVFFWSLQHSKDTDTRGIGPAQRLRDGEGPGQMAHKGTLRELPLYSWQKARLRAGSHRCSSRTLTSFPDPIPRRNSSCLSPTCTSLLLLLVCRVIYTSVSNQQHYLVCSHTEPWSRLAGIQHRLLGHRACSKPGTR